MNLMSARGVIIPAALTFAAVLWWAGRGGNVAPEVPESIASSGAASITAPGRLGSSGTRARRQR
jgi:hypothetical protein